MALDSDVHNADSHLHVEFYLNSDGDYKANPRDFIRIIVPGDKTNVVDQPVREDHKERFPRQYLYWKMQSTDASAIGTPLLSLVLGWRSLRTPSILASLVRGFKVPTGRPTSCSNTPRFTTRSA